MQSGARLISSTDELDLLEPLWNSLREHYEAMEGRPGDVYSREESWGRRRRTYEELLSTESGFIVALEAADHPMAYAAVRIVSASPVFTWSERTGLVETFVVDARYRGQGVGRSLLEAVRAILREHEADEVILQVVASNRQAVDFYRDVGFRTYCLLLSDSLPTQSPGRAAADALPP